MKLSKSKLALAKVINGNGGWPSDEANFAAQDKIDGESNDNTVSFYSGKVKPTRRADCSMWRCEDAGSHFMGYEKTIKRCKLLPNWHQTCLSREEYHHAYPKADADGWIEWSGGECPVDGDALVVCKVRTGKEWCNGRAIKAAILLWRHTGGAADIIAYRQHRPEKIMKNKAITQVDDINVVESKPTIEQLAQDYRNKLYFANRKQQEADDARVAADVALGKLERAGEEIGLLIGIHKDGSVVDYLGWNSWVAGDLVELVNHRGGMAKVGEIGPISKVVGGGDFYVDFPSQLGYSVEHSDVKFIRRP